MILYRTEAVYTGLGTHASSGSASRDIAADQEGIGKDTTDVVWLKRIRLRCGRMSVLLSQRLTRQSFPNLRMKLC
jgi:hypothetical protein